MGQEDKLFLNYQGMPIVRHVYQQIATSQVEEVIVVTRNETHLRIRKLLDDQVTIVDNPRPLTGMTSSIQVGVSATHGDSNAYMICLADQPFLTVEDYNQILHGFKIVFPSQPRLIGVPVYQGKKGNPVILSSGFREEIMRHEHPEGCKEIVQLNHDHVRKIEVTSDAILRDIDTMEDYRSLI